MCGIWVDSGSFVRLFFVSILVSLFVVPLGFMSVCHKIHVSVATMISCIYVVLVQFACVHRTPFSDYCAIIVLKCNIPSWSFWPQDPLGSCGLYPLLISCTWSTGPSMNVLYILLLYTLSFCIYYSGADVTAKTHALLCFCFLSCHLIVHVLPILFSWVSNKLFCKLVSSLS